MHKEPKQRTTTQNAALYKYFELLADELNSAGLSMQRVLKPSIEITWDKNNIKKYLWHEIQEAMYDKRSTTELSTSEVSKVYEVLNRHLGEKFGVHVSFPSEEPPLFNPLPE